MPKKWINLILSSAIFIIWIVIFYRLFFSDTQMETEMIDTPGGHTTAVISISKYDSLSKSDPFKNPYNNFRKKVIQPRPRIQQKMRQPLSIKVLGILADEKGKLAIIELGNGESRFVREGEQVDDMKILKILDDEIEVLYEKQKIKILL